jgi:hypothetical protein
MQRRRVVHHRHHDPYRRRQARRDGALRPTSTIRLSPHPHLNHYHRTEQEWLEQFRTGTLQIQSLEWDEIDIRTHAYAHFAIAIGRLTQAATYARKPADGPFRVTAIAIGHGTSWHLAGAHYSPIAAP